MAVVFVDSFDHYTTDGTGKWAGWSYADISAGNGRFGTAAQRLWFNFGYVWRSLPTANTYWAGVASAAGWNTGVLSLGGLYMGVTGEGKIQARRGGYAGTVLGTSVDSAPASGYHFYELYVKMSATIGEVTVRVDEVAYLTLTGQNTGASDISTVTVGDAHPGGAGSWYSNRYFDDVYVDNAQFNGDCRVQCIMPTGAGNYSQWTPSTGNNWDCVNEIPQSSADYVSEGTVGDIDTYVVQNVTPTAGTVYAVAGNFWAMKSDAGTRQIAIATRLSGTDDAGSGIALGSSWGFIQDIKTTKPGGGAWSISDINDAELGVKMIS